MHSYWWLAGQFVLVAAGGTVLVAGIVAAWYVLSWIVLLAISRLLPLSGRKPGN